MDFITIYAGPL